ncbi:MAG: YhgE/Pip domain-containing protein [Lachnospiraceae bacterium]|nr:YhgE/Pip domain-containing protein [Lachnospiraceae bacterium]
MLINELKSLWNNKLMLLAVVGIALIPLIYAGTFVGSLLDPYGSIDKLPVAVVNQDKAYDYEGKTLTIGDDLVDELKENDSLQFNFVDKDVAKEGLENGTFYMVITIPQDFSKNSATLMDDNPQKMELKYETNPGTNFIASKMSESALTKIKDKVQESVVESYAETVFDSLSEAGDGLAEASDGAGKLKDGANEASKGNDTITTNLQKLKDGALTLSDGTNQLADGSKTLEKGLKTYTNGVSTINKKSPSLVSGVNALNSGAKDLSAGTKTFDSGVNEYVAGVNALAGGLVGDGTASNPGYLAGTAQLAQGINQLAALENGLPVVYQSIQKLNAATAADSALYQGSAQVSGGLSQVIAGVKALQGSTSEETLKQFATALTTAGNTMKSGATKIGTANAQIGAAKDTISASMKEIESFKGDISSANATIKDRNDAIASAVKQTNSDIDDAYSDIDDAYNKAESDLRAAKISTDGLEGEELEAAKKANEKIDGAIASLNNSSKKPGKVEKKEISEISTSGTENLEKQKATLSGIKDGLGEQDLTVELQTIAALGKQLGGVSIPDDPFGNLITNLTALQNGSSSVTSGIATLNSNISVLENATTNFPAAGAGIGQLKSGAAVLVANNEALSTGANALLANGIKIKAGSLSLSEGSKTLYGGTSQLADGADALANGVSTLASNNKKLNSGAAALTNGAGKLNAGANTIADGSGQLADGSAKLGNGLTKISNGSGELADALSEGADKIKENKTDTHTYKMFAAPVEDQETQITQVKNNGHGMLPYMMSVGLWVGALAFCLIYPLMQHNGELKSGLSWWASKAAILYAVGALQAVLLVSLLTVFIGFEPALFGKTMLVALFASAAFISIMYLFNVVFGKLGSFMMLVFMVIQLAGSAGTYPVEISPHFVSVIHKYVPFTYTVDAFRRTIAGSGSIKPALLVLGGMCIICTLLTILSFVVKTKRMGEGKFILYYWLEERGFA